LYLFAIIYLVTTYVKGLAYAITYSVYKYILYLLKMQNHQKLNWYMTIGNTAYNYLLGKIQ